MHPAKAADGMRCHLARTLTVVPVKIMLDRGLGPDTERGNLGVGTPVKICMLNCGQTVTDSGMVSK